MRVLTTLCVCAALAGCGGTPKRSTSSAISPGDLAVFNKTFTGTIVDVSIVEPTKGKVSCTYIKMKVKNADGLTRTFFDCSSDERRAKELHRIYRDVYKGAEVVVDLGPIDQQNDIGQADQLNPAERFDNVTLTVQ